MIKKNGRYQALFVWHKEADGLEIFDCGVEREPAIKEAQVICQRCVPLDGSVTLYDPEGKEMMAFFLTKDGTVAELPYDSMGRPRK